MKPTKMRTLLNLFRDYVSPASSENGDEDTKDRVKKDFEDDEDTVRVLDDGLEGQAIEEGNGNQESDRETWDSPIEFLLSCLSFAVGLGNIWRFPYLCFRNGGGAFLIPYAINIFLTGIPLFFFELSFGQFASKSPVSIWSISPLFQGIGLSMLVISVSVGIYYNVIIAWTVYYLGSTVSSIFNEKLPWTTCDNEWNTDICQELHNAFKNQTDEDSHLLNNTLHESAAEQYFSNHMLQISSGIAEPGSLRLELAGCLLLTWVLVFLALLNGVKSFGKAVYFTAIFPYVILTILLVRGLTLPGAIDGVKFYIEPKWEKLWEVQVWADAAIQIFFSLGPCWGALITLASYNKFSNNCFRDAVFIGFANCLTSFFAGFVVFSFVGFMAYELEKDISHVAKDGPGLAFVVYPEAVSLLPGSKIWAALFFIMLLALGFGTQFSILEAIVTIIVDAWPAKWGRLNHRRVLFVVCVSMFLAGLTMVTEGGMYVLQLLDNHAGTFSALMNGVVEVVVVAWLYGVDRFLGDINVMFNWSKNSLGLRLFRLLWTVMWKFVTPIVLLFILSVTFAGYKPLKYGDYEYPMWANGIGWWVTASSVSFIPLAALHKIITTPGNKWTQLRDLMKPDEDWGPKDENDRLRAEQVWFESGHPFKARQMKELSLSSKERQGLIDEQGLATVS